MKKGYVFLLLMFAAIAFEGFLRTPGSQNVRAVQIVDLIASGACLGVALARIAAWMRERPQS